MNINRYNYEEFFLLYIDNELTKAERLEVETFVHDNPDLEEELVMLKQSKLKPDTSVQFEGKAALLKPETSGSFISETNYEEFFLLYIDDELDAISRREVEQFAAMHPQLQQELNLLLQTKAEPEHAIVFPDKSLLYRKSETEKKPVVIGWWRIAAVAAMILLALGIFWISNNNNSGKPEIVAKKDEQNNSVKDQPTVNTIIPEEKKEQPAVVQENTQQQLAVQNKTKKPVDVIRNEVNKGVTENQLPKNDLVKEEVEQPLRSLEASDVTSTIASTTNNKSINTGVETAYVTSAVEVVGSPVKETKDIFPTVDEDDNVYIANTAVNRNKLRGLVRKVTRVFDKTTNLPAVEGKRNTNREL